MFDKPNSKEGMVDWSQDGIDQPQTAPRRPPLHFGLNREPWTCIPPASDAATNNKNLGGSQCIPMPAAHSPPPDARNGHGEMSRGAGQEWIGSFLHRSGASCLRIVLFHGSRVSEMRDARCTMHPLSRPSRQSTVVRSTVEWLGPRSSLSGDPFGRVWAVGSSVLGRSVDTAPAEDWLPSPFLANPVAVHVSASACLSVCLSVCLSASASGSRADGSSTYVPCMPLSGSELPHPRRATDGGRRNGDGDGDGARSSELYLLNNFTVQLYGITLLPKARGCAVTFCLFCFRLPEQRQVWSSGRDWLLAQGRHAVRRLPFYRFTPPEPK